MTLRVYGRVEYAEPLVELGTANEGADLRAAYPDDWVELVTFTEDAIHWIIRNGENVDAD